MKDKLKITVENFSKHFSSFNDMILFVRSNGLSAFLDKYNLSLSLKNELCIYVCNEYVSTIHLSSKWLNDLINYLSQSKSNLIKIAYTYFCLLNRSSDLEIIDLFKNLSLGSLYKIINGDSLCFKQKQLFLFGSNLKSIYNYNSNIYNKLLEVILEKLYNSLPNSTTESVISLIFNQIEFDINDKIKLMKKLLHQNKLKIFHLKRIFGNFCFAIENYDQSEAEARDKIFNKISKKFLMACWRMYKQERMRRIAIYTADLIKIYYFKFGITKELFNLVKEESSYLYAIGTYPSIDDSFSKFLLFIRYKFSPKEIDKLILFVSSDKDLVNSENNFTMNYLLNCKYTHLS